jgi:hypothetical protein
MFRSRAKKNARCLECNVELHEDRVQRANGNPACREHFDIVYHATVM